MYPKHHCLHHSFVRTAFQTLILWAWGGLLGIALFWVSSAHAASTLTVTPTTIGSLQKLSLVVQLDVADVDVNQTGQVFVVAVLPDQRTFALTPSGWTAASDRDAPAYFEGRLGTHVMDILAGVNVSTLGGTVFYVGYGPSWGEVLRLEQFREAYIIPHDVPFTSFQGDWKKPSDVRYYVFRKVELLKMYWGTIVNVPIAADGTPLWVYPNVDWNTQMVVGLVYPSDYGGCSSGTSAYVTKVLNNGKRIEVYTRVNVPILPSFLVCTGGLEATHNVDFVILPHSNLPVVFLPTSPQ